MMISWQTPFRWSLTHDGELILAAWDDGEPLQYVWNGRVLAEEMAARMLEPERYRAVPVPHVEEGVP